MKNTIVVSQICMMLIAVVFGAGVWLYAKRVLIPYQKSDAETYGRPRGNFSDLYPRWLGARELLLRGRDPYSAEVTREIQAGYYGRALDSTRAGDPQDQQAFAYPVYVAFLLAPTVRMPFEVVRPIFFWMLVVLSASSTLIWLRALRWECTPVTRFTAVVLTLGSLAAMQGLKLEQISLLVSGMVAISVILLMRDHPVPAGILLAFATIKPQLVVLLLLWLAMWTLADWRRRYLWCASFLVTMIILLAASEWFLPHWIPRFWQALREYQDYTGAQRVLEKLVGTVWGRTLEALAIAMMLDVCWTRRRQAADTTGFVFAVSIALGITVLVAPTYAVYNQVLLIPALLMLVEQRGAMWRKNMATRLLLTATAILVAWPWIASVALAAVSFILPRETVQRGWAVPFWSALLIPVGVASAMLVLGGQKSFAASAKAGTS